MTFSEWVRSTERWFSQSQTIQTKILFIDTQSYLWQNGRMENMKGKMMFKKSNGYEKTICCPLRKQN
jgi:hypothetical protein